MYEYRARAIHVVDGDTVDLIVDCGFTINIEIRVRVLGLDTPERGQTNYKEATERTREFCMDNHPDENLEWPLYIRTQKDEKGSFGRYLAEVYRANGTRSLTEVIIAEELGVPYSR